MKLISIVLLLSIGFALAFASSKTLESTNQTEFCTSCHSMQWVQEEWMESVHYKNISGVRANCSDCHVPHETGPKLVAKLRAAKDVWHEIMGTIDDEEKFEHHRWQMANAVWDRMKATDSRECQSCHTAEAMDLKEQDRSARKKHRRILKENNEKTCIDCHKGVAHKVPKEPKEVALQE
ncbi:MAG: NapC/NirT family cytochrome c [Pseudomonadota bacterium]